MSMPFGRHLWRAFTPRLRPSSRPDVPAAIGASDAELVRLANGTDATDIIRRQAQALAFGGRRAG